MPDVPKELVVKATVKRFCDLQGFDYNRLPNPDWYTQYVKRLDDFIKAVDKETNKMQTVIFDFDGVIHSYSSGWKGPAVIPDPPVNGIREAIAEIRKEYKVVVVSSRCYQEGGIQAIKDYLQLHSIEVDDVTGEKPAAVVTIDDRGITFDGHPETLLEKIKSFKPWNKR